MISSLVKSEHFSTRQNFRQVQFDSSHRQSKCYTNRKFSSKCCKTRWKKYKMLVTSHLLFPQSLISKVNFLRVFETQNCVMTCCLHYVRRIVTDMNDVRFDTRRLYRTTVFSCFGMSD